MVNRISLDSLDTILLSHKNTTWNWSLFFRTNAACKDHRTRVFIGTPARHSVHHSRPDTSMITSGKTIAQGLFFYSALYVKQRAFGEIYRFLLPSCRICHREKGRIASGRVAVFLRVNNTTTKMYLKYGRFLFLL